MKALALGLATTALLAGCGGSSPSQPSGSMKVTMTEFKFDPSSITVPHGKAVFFLVNSGTTQHDLAIRDSTGNRLAVSELVSAGDSVVFTVNNIDPGTYTIFCTQQGHEASGMKGTLTVT
jgi:plastocyanin